MTKRKKLITDFMDGQEFEEARLNEGTSTTDHFFLSLYEFMHLICLLVWTTEPRQR